ncbi:TolC family protein [Formosa maritima]|uniref:TolC family protein n=1 Tax=Formosa maritima TaxID=2592046 RepID=A0A5D0G118_9FLAO|nr:TolC family protein [Formosa maritima]TYA52434.1 TolC family protein [Formosa maritima]
MKTKLIILFSLIFTISIYSQEDAYNFSLLEAIDFAIENNRASKNATRDIEAAKKQKWEATATGLPQLDAKIDYQNWLKQQVSLLPGEIAGGDPGTFIPVAFSTDQSVVAMATLNQLLFDGSYLVGLKSAEVYLEISRFAKEKTDLDVRKAVINAYGNVLLTEESLVIINKNIEVIQKNLNETTKIYENGLTEEEDVEQLEITLSNLQSAYSNMSRMKIIAYQMFNITLGIDLNSNTTLTEDLEALTLKNISLSLLEVNENVENTIDFKIAENDKATKELLLKLEKSKFLPNLSAFINAGYNGFNEEFTFTHNNQEWFGSSLFGVTMNIPIFSSGMRSASTQRAKINLDKATEDLIEVEQNIKLEIASAKSDYQFAIEEYYNKKENLNLAERIERKNQTKFFEGIASSFDLRQAQTQLYSAQDEYLQTMINVINSKTKLETVLNTIVD